MKVYCFWLCKTIGAPFMVDSVDVVTVCPFHSDEPPMSDYVNHFEDGHLRRIFAEDLIIMENAWIKKQLKLEMY